MKAKWFKEVKGLLASQAFKDWWREYTRTLIELDRAREHLDELLTQENLMDFRSELAQKNAIDKLYLSTSYEDQATGLVAEASELENSSYESVANFEKKRIFVSDLWFRKGALEHHIESLKSQLGEKNAKIAQSKERNELINLKSDSRTIEADLRRLEKEHRKLTEEYEKESQIKSKLWEEVESVWTRSLGLNLAVAESKVKGKKVKTEAQRFFADSEDSKKRAAEVKNKAEHTSSQVVEFRKKLDNLLVSARCDFECIAQEDFLYWQQRENNRMVYCLPLVTDLDNYNIEIKALTVYQADRQNGVGFLEPAVPVQQVEIQEDKRLDDFFTSGRNKRAEG
jgi:chromosome segregation ATPase